MSRWRIGRLSARAVPVDESLRMVTLHETRYTGWTITHFHEHRPTEHIMILRSLHAGGMEQRAPMFPSFPIAHRIHARRPCNGYNPIRP